MEQNTEKKMTNYERKLQAREAAAKREKKKNILTVVATVAILACIAALLIIVPIIKDKQKFKEYFRINNESVSQLEFLFHKTGLVNSYSGVLPYFGISTAEDLVTTVYDDSTGQTWDEFFTENAVLSIKENRALIADAKANNFTFDIEADYKTYMEQVKEEAEAAGMSVSSYLNSLFGAKEKDLKNIVMDNLTAVAYSKYLFEQNAATDEEAQTKYDANKDDYDSVDYRVLEFAADVTEDSNDAEVETAMADAKKKAQEMLDKVKAGEDFETLCATYAPEDKRTDYANSETDLSLVTGATTAYSYDPYIEWLFDAARKDGDTAIHTDEANNTHYALLFEKRYMGDTVLDTIKQELANTRVTEYVTKISKSFTVSDPKDNLPTM